MVDLFGRRVTIRRQILFGIATLSFVLISTLLVTPLFDLTRYQLTVGQPSPRKVTSRLKFKVEDREKKQAVRTAQVLSIVPRFLRDGVIEKTAQQEARRIFESLRKISRSETPEQDRLRDFSALLDEPSAQEALKLSEKDWTNLEKAAQSLIHEFMAEKGILNNVDDVLDLDLHRHLQYEIRYDTDSASPTFQRVRGQPEPLDMKGLAGYLESSVGVIYPNLSGPRLIFSILMRVMKPNQVFDRQHYRMEVERIDEKIQPIYQEFFPGNLIVQENQTVTESHLLALREMQKADRARLAVTGVAAFAILSLFTILILQYLRVYQPDRLKDTGWMWFLGVLFLFMLALARVVWTLTDSRLAFAFALPVPTYAMLLAIFYRPRVAMLSSPLLAVSIAMLYGCNYQLMLVHTVTAIASVFVVRHTRTMGDIVKAGLFLMFISPITVLASHFVMIDYAHTRELFISAALSAFSGILLVPFLTFGLIHFIPILFGLPSDFKILEMSDLNHPLLRQMQLEAPGSYQHSQTVSILSEAACESIGANSLLARVGSYYHDIGKMKKPEYFTENQKYIIDESGEIIGKETKDIKPSLYASVLKSHVKMGVELAKEHRLPKILIDFIEQHHGTSLMKSLYDAALNQSTEEDVAERESFIYPGPRPRFRETAVVMLADTVEAAIRSLENPTPHRIEEEVHRLVQSKVADGQLDDSSLTLKDLKKVEEAFIRILNSIYHTRIVYPSDEELKRKDKEKHKGEG